MTWLYTDLLVLWLRLDEWKAAKDKSEGNQIWRTAQGADKTPFEQLDAFVQSERAANGPRQAEEYPDQTARRGGAADVLKAFSAYMPDFYSQTLNATFIKPPMNHVYCYHYYDVDKDWGQHLGTCQLPKGIQPQQVNGYCPTLGPGADRTNMRPGDTRRTNRRVEFTKQANHHTLVHEMLHWSCHENFRQATITRSLFTDPAQLTLVLEGTTEYLARYALKEWDRGGYENFMPGVIATVNGGHPAVPDLCKAYFQGSDLKTGADRVGPGSRHSNQAASGTPTSPKLSNTIPFPRRQDMDPTTASPKFMDTAKMYANGKTVAQVTAGLNARPGRPGCNSRG